MESSRTSLDSFWGPSGVRFVTCFLSDVRWRFCVSFVLRFWDDMGLDFYDFDGGFITRDLLGRLRSQKCIKYEKAIGVRTGARCLKVRG